MINKKKTLGWQKPLFHSQKGTSNGLGVSSKSSHIQNSKHIAKKTADDSSLNGNRKIEAEEKKSQSLPKNRSKTSENKPLAHETNTKRSLGDSKDSILLTGGIDVVNDPRKINSNTSSISARLSHIDGMRALAILFMVWVHIAAAFRPASPPSFTGLAISSIFGGLAAPLFITVSGWGLHQSARRRLAITDSPLLDISRWLAPRIVLLLACQFIINSLMAHVFDISTPGVLTLLILAAILAPCTAGLSPRFRAGLVLGFSLSPMLLGELAGPTWCWNERMAGVGLLGTIERLLWNGAYPALPWLAFSLLGSLIADMSRNDRIKAIVALIPIGIMATIILRPEGGGLVATIGNASLTFFPASAAFMLVAITTVLMIHLGLESIEGHRFWRSRLGESSIALGKLSLTVYILHFIPISLLHHYSGTMVISNIYLALIIIIYTLLWLPTAALHSRFIPTLSLEVLLSRFEA